MSIDILLTTCFVRRALVIYNAAVAAAAVNPNQNPVLLVGNQQLTPFIHASTSRTLLILPGLDVTFIRDSITPV